MHTDQSTLAMLLSVPRAGASPTAGSRPRVDAGRIPPSTGGSGA
ncbi:MAG: hypothetical protein R6V31_12415 [Halohasta sp.]